jgi:uncharacterized protein YgbK (DUF1537 family)
MTLNALVVADDLTGAMDTGHEFAAGGYPTTVAVGADGARPEEGVLVVNTDSRYLPPEEAREAVERAVEDAPARTVYKKVDSTLRGNLVAEIEGALDASGADVALVAPALPAGGRLTACGYHLVEGALVTDTAAGQDPDRPVTSAHLPTLLGGGTHAVGHVGVETVASGADAVADAVRGAGGAVLACDAVHDHHLAALGRGARRTEREVVYVGSAGLAGAIELPDDPDPGTTVGGERALAADDPEPTAGGARVLGIAGSASPTTLDQLQAVEDERIVGLDGARAAVDPASAADDAVARAFEVFDEEGTVVVASVLREGDVDRTLRAGRDAGVDPATVRERVAESLAMVATRAWERDPPDGLFVTGGAVAGRVFDALGATGVRLTGEAVEVGVPVGRVLDGTARGTRVVTKAGAFGSERTIAKCLTRLEGSDDR